MSPVGTPTATQPAVALRFRRDAASLTRDQLALLRQAFDALYGIKDDRGYLYFAGIHGLPLPISCGNAHGTPYFLPWHRAYLYFFERAMRDQVADAELAWWDWRTPATARGTIPRSFSAARTGQTANPLYSGPVDPLALTQGRRQGLDVASSTQRRPGAAGAPRLPSVQEVEQVLRLSDFVDFSGQVEELHNRVHVWVGGHMGMIPFAAFDPIFWAHHTMIDRLWRLWQLRYPNATPPAALLDQALPPFRMTVRQTLDVTALGYDYAVASSSQLTIAPGGG
jgi:tyrosinase